MSKAELSSIGGGLELGIQLVTGALVLIRMDLALIYLQKTIVVTCKQAPV